MLLRSHPVPNKLGKLLGSSLYGLERTPGQLIFKMVASNSFKTMNSARFCMDIRSSNGILESVLSAVTLRELDRHSRARNVQKQRILLRMKHTNIGTLYETERR